MVCEPVVGPHRPEDADRIIGATLGRECRQLGIRAERLFEALFHHPLQRCRDRLAGHSAFHDVAEPGSPALIGWLFGGEFGDLLGELFALCVG